MKRMRPRTTLCVHLFRNGNILKINFKKSCCKLIITGNLPKETGHCEAPPQRNIKNIYENLNLREKIKRMRPSSTLWDHLFRHSTVLKKTIPESKFLIC